MTKKNTSFKLINSDSLKSGNKILVFGVWMEILKVKHLNHHPIQLYEIYLKDLPCLRVPADWQIKTQFEG